MNYKQRYKEAIERMKSLARSEHPEYFTEAQKLAEFTFPELKESEDERIREEIKQFLKKHNGWIKEWIDWLEKQGEQKSVEDPLTLEEFENAFITKAKQYDIDLPNRSWDIYALCKELYSLKHKPMQGEQKSADKIEPKFNVGD